MPYVSITKVSDKMLSKYGAPITIRRKKQSGFNPTSGQFASELWDDYETRALVRVPSPGTDQFVPGGVIIAGDVELTVPVGGLMITPQPGDTILMNDQRYSIINNAPLQPGGGVIQHKLYCRKG